eukprot:CAMPEP_0115724116 /NCGR_PEP_ID=MMETSP0272-20121206/80609_1 /TAXON_ID=71861 /ORGANISM="Scrippsiella trochoidea, Strain CCMP3099" /LENGTH=128 /DNA_ID=CAMNT_0003167323 /DNA_START=39 /DNA_END=422 /DNA_ORIENTATION=+
MMEKAVGVAMYDFQWFGRGPPTKDIVYFLATGPMLRMMYDPDVEEKYLRFYHGELCALLSKQGDEPPTFEYFHDSYRLACFDYRRWAEGGFMWGSQDLLDANTDYVWEKLCAAGGVPKSDTECRDRIF